MKDIMFYEINGRKFKAERTPAGGYKLTTKDETGVYYNLFCNIDQLFREMISYTVVDEDEWND